MYRDKNVQTDFKVAVTEGNISALAHARYITAEKAGVE